MKQKKKHLSNLTITDNQELIPGFFRIKATDRNALLPDMQPGQFAELKVSGNEASFLRIPIGIHFVDRETNEVWFLIHAVGDGTCQLAALRKNDHLDAILPLGRGFSLPDTPGRQVLLIGGGVGVAPLLFQGKVLKENGHTPIFLMGARSQSELLQVREFQAIGEVYTTTDDGSEGEKGYVTQHSLLDKPQAHFDLIQTCGPRSMMEAVARYARHMGTECEVSLENTMGCGIGVCLCCVENTIKGHLRVCKDGPVFNMNDLLWQI